MVMEKIKNLPEGSERYHSLDYLRGACAFGILLYHYFSWTFGIDNNWSIFNKIGIYGVSVFYVLSGLTLYLVYVEKKEAREFLKIKSLKSFYVKRIFRIMPLFWVVITGAIVIYNLNPTPMEVFLEYSGLFSLIDWDLGFSPGIWSIGNELVFYCLFPLLVLSTLHQKYMTPVLLVTFTAAFVYFSFFFIPSLGSLNEKWSWYKNPLNQVIYFFVGFLLGQIGLRRHFSKTTGIAFFCFGLALFVFLPIDHHNFKHATGWSRLLLSLASIVVCAGVFLLREIKLKPIHKMLSFLGGISYSLYLLHPLVFNLTKRVAQFMSAKGIEVNNIVFFFVFLTGTLISSFLVYEFIEKKIILFGKKMLDRK